ncbi:MAG: Trm112 family protein [Sphingomonadaceae bacterium]|nr:Trm112 family protein [Sphingomonadaceae bacterium]
MINPVLLDRLVCPITRTALVYDAERQELISHAAGLAFPVRDGVAIMLVEEARPIAADAD